MSHQQANLYKETHRMLKEIIDDANKDHQLPAKKASKASVIHELVKKAHNATFTKKPKNQPIESE